ncbi:hypothetical protein HanIR_Chr01g0011911 [Helianthus annuus]|nr:hypothetical protein HanIR_Chr01g0011911 [Helianthus annuus]
MCILPATRMPILVHHEPPSLPKHGELYLFHLAFPQWHPILSNQEVQAVSRLTR